MPFFRVISTKIILAYCTYIVLWLYALIFNFTTFTTCIVHRDKIFKVQVLTGKSISNTKFSLVFFSENRK